MSRAVIFLNGIIPDLTSVRSLIRPDDLLIAADGGTRHILALGLLPVVLVGDLDSLSIENRQSLNQEGTRIFQYPHDKNETDFELALHYAVDQGHHEILIVAALGGRLDQTLGNLSLLTDRSLAGFDIRLDDGLQEAFFVHGECKVQGSRGDVISLIPWGGEIRGVTTNGLRWPLSGEMLWSHQTRGISNELLDETASIRLESGILLVVHYRVLNDKAII